MECPACGHDSHRILRTHRAKRQDRREALCKNCGTIHYQIVEIDTVVSRDPESGRAREYKLSVFLTMIAYHMGRALHPTIRGRLDA